MDEHAWMRELPAGITVCDRDGKIIELNAASERIFAPDGGAALIGQNLFGCHPADASEKLRAMMAEQRANIYISENGGTPLLVYETPWYQNGEYAGFVEFEIPLTVELLHILRG